MVAEAEKIISEIQQIKEQYQKEVGSKRKPWPRSIAERVEKLFHLGVSGPSISKDCDIPYHTILNWKPRVKIKSPVFHALTVRPEPQNQMSTVTVGSLKKVDMVTVFTPRGYRFEGTAESLVVILKSVKGL